MLFLSVGCGYEYSAEKLYWKANKFSDQIFLNPKGTPAMQYEKTIAVFRKVIENYPQSKKAQESQFKIGQLYFVWEKFSQAIKEYEKLLQNYSKETMLCSSAQFAIGNCYEQQGNWKEALAVYREVFNNYRNTSLGLEIPLYIVQHYQNNNQTAEAEESLQEAVTDYQEIITDNPKSQIAYIAYDYITICYVRLNQWHKAIESLEKLIDDYPDSPKTAETLITIGTIYQDNLKQSEKANMVYQKFLKKYPKHILADEIRARIKNL